MGNYQKLVLLVGLPLMGWAIATSTGCKGSPSSAHRWGGSQFGQGSIDRQKSRAVTFDPYPLNDIGPPIVGGRPREYANPLPEAARNELTARPTSPWTGYQGR